jgi:hypothetical protein
MMADIILVPFEEAYWILAHDRWIVSWKVLLVPS